MFTEIVEPQPPGKSREAQKFSVGFGSNMELKFLPTEKQISFKGDPIYAQIGRLLTRADDK